MRSYRAKIHSELVFWGHIPRKFFWVENAKYRKMIVPVSSFMKLKKNAHLTSFRGNIPCADTLVALVLVNFGIFVVNFEKTCDFGG